MDRKIELDWSQRFDFVGNLTTGPTNGSSTSFQVKPSLRSTYSSLFGIYMFLEDTSFEPARRSAIEGWRKSHGLTTTGALKPIYIGIVKSDQRGFVERMREHHKKWIYQYHEKGQLFVKFATTYYWCKDEELPQLIEDAESVLVFEMQPYENTSKIGSYSISEHILVKNTGHHAPLPKSLSSKKHF